VEQMMKILMVATAMVMIKCSAWKRRMRKTKLAQDKGEFDRAILFW
jgi:hypothetical protein